ncbi:MAG: hypothetical protein CW338_12070 [Clostridiales bacterium]|nr:hypothetical protein [Clostridiales bacterium]
MEVRYTTEYYTLTVLYLNAKTGEEMAPSVSRRLAYCDLYEIESPYIEGYTPNMSVVSGMMYDRDKTITVLYSVDDITIIDNFTVPRGIPNQSVSYGDCVE